MRPFVASRLISLPLLKVLDPPLSLLTAQCASCQSRLCEFSMSVFSSGKCYTLWVFSTDYKWKWNLSKPVNTMCHYCFLLQCLPYFDIAQYTQHQTKTDVYRYSASDKTIQNNNCSWASYVAGELEVSFLTRSMAMWSNTVRAWAAI